MAIFQLDSNRNIKLLSVNLMWQSFTYHDCCIALETLSYVNNLNSRLQSLKKFNLKAIFFYYKEAIHDL